jgi:TolA-binding protein
LGLLLIALILPATVAASAAQGDSAAPARQYRAAAALQRSGQYALAAESWAELLDTFPDNIFVPQASLNLGICHLKAKEYDKAIESFQAVVQKHPKFEMLDAAYLYLGTTQYNIAQSGKPKLGKPKLYDAAAATFQVLIAKYPKGKYTARAIYYRGECLYARDKKAEAAAGYAELLERFPNDELALDALYALGVTQEELGRYEAAGKSYDAFLEKYPKDALAVEVAMRRGETLFALKQYQAAIEWFAHAAGRKGFRMADHAAIRQAAALAQLKKYAESARLYGSVPEKFPKSRYVGTANLAGGKCYFLAGEYKAARALLGRLLAAGGKSSPEAAHWFARSLLKQNRPAEALDALEKVLPKSGKSPWAARLRMDQADALYEIPDRRSESVSRYAALASEYPEAPEAESALYMAGFVALGQGDFKAARTHATAFLNKYTKSELLADVTAVAAESNLQLGKPAEAERLFGQLLAEYADRPEAASWQVRRGLTLHLQKKYKETIAALEPVLESIGDPAALAEARYLVGGSQAELKRFDAAIVSLEASLAAKPDWRQADDTLLVLANAYRHTNQLDKAMASAGKLIAQFPKSRLLDRAHYWLGEYAYAGGDYETAAAEHRRVVDTWPKSNLVPHALFGLGWSQLNRKDHAGAEKAFSRLVEAYPKHKLTARARFARGTARQQLGKYAPAVDDLQAMLAAGPTAAERSDARYILGLCQAGMKNHAEAAAAFEALLKDDPKYTGADKVLYELAWTLSAMKKNADAAERFDRLAKSHPDSPLAAEALYHVGEFHYNRKQYDKAATAYHAAAEKTAGKTIDAVLKEKAAHKLSWSYFHQDKFAEARRSFASQRKTFPDGKLASDAAMMEGECLFKQDKFEQALAAYEEVKNPSSDDFGALSLLHAGQAAAQLKQWKKSLELLTRCARRFPDSVYLPEVLYEQGYARQNLGQLDEAAGLYRSVIAKTNREVAARAQFMIGEIFFQRKKHADAIKTFYKVIYGYSYPQWQANATFEAARCFEVLKKKDQAVKLYEELLEKYPKSDKASPARQRLNSLKQ